MNVGIVGLALATSFALTPALSSFLKRVGILDRPNPRSSHSVPIPRAGGLAPAIAASVALIGSSEVGAREQALLVAVATGFGIIGLADDLLYASAPYRLALQFLIAGAALPALIEGFQFESIDLVAIGAVAVIWQVGYVNAFNFMDGINGISVAQTIVAGSTWVAVGYVENINSLIVGGAVIAAAGLGFAPFNFPRASVFLGDVGSYFLGEWLAMLALIGIFAGAPVAIMVAPLFVYVADTASTLVHRVRSGEPWYLPHRDHVYQQLIRAGWSHAKTTTFTAGFMVVCSAAGALSLLQGIEWQIAALVVVGAVGLGYLYSPQVLRVDSRR
jgi:UDP-GlcNAc:undecaprenyl-phosphate GlcNAc-1-phosphate transferase